MGFGLRMNGHPKEEIRQKVAEASRILKLDDYLKRKPKALSGGQRQRVAIGRAIVRDPDVFLFDEPLSNLDAELRVEMRVEIAQLHKTIGATMIYVTHDQVEAMTLADKIVVLRKGHIEQVGSPLHLYDDPDNKFVAGFIGSPAMNFLKGTVVGQGVHVPAIDQTIPVNVESLPSEGSAVTLGIRPQGMEITRGGTLTCDITEHLGGVSYLYLDAETGERLVVEARESGRTDTSGQVGVSFDPAGVMLFDAQSEARIR